MSHSRESHVAAETLLDGYQVLADVLLTALADRCPGGRQVAELTTIFFDAGVGADGGACTSPELCSVAMRDFARRADRAGRLMRLVLGRMARDEAAAVPG